MIKKMPQTEIEVTIKKNFNKAKKREIDTSNIKTEINTVQVFCFIFN